MSIAKIMFRAFSLFAQLLLAVVMFTQSTSVVAIAKCMAAPGNHYEEVFCQLSSSRYKLALPSLQEFRRNPANVQYLLLKRAASREGIRLLKPVRQVSPAASSTPMSASKPGINPKAPTHLAEKARERRDQQSCRFTIRKIQCGNRQYRLQTNLSNAELAPEALGDGNALRLPVKQDSEPIEEWLARAYNDYITALISIGLAGSSSTYSAFAHTYYELDSSGADFVARIQKSFSLLKKDKRTLGVSKRYPKSAPVADDCERLNSGLIVCNSTGKNWVYTAD